MFDRSGWFVIDATNQPVKGVRVASLETGLALVGEGQVATVVGRLRPELRVVDVDLAGERGHAVAEQLAGWCQSQGRRLWHLIRPSGGADGRCHVFIAPEQHADELVTYVDKLRSTMRASAKAIDLRTSGHIRPLSAPHRRGGHSRPYGDLRRALRSLRTHPWADTAATTPRRSDRNGAAATATPLLPRPRPRTEVPAEWATYLRTGIAPPHGGSDHSRSTDELLATTALLRAGHTADTAWTLITAAHPDAMARARASKRRWIAWVWNRAVTDDFRHPATTSLSPATAAAIAHARAELTNLMWMLPVRRRRALLLVGHHVLDRMARTNSRRVPVPERDLVEDTTLTDRKTIRAALRLLDGPVGTLHTNCWNPTKRRDSSSFEFEIPPAPPDQGVTVIPPPSSHTPLPRGTWSQLRGHAHGAWRTLQAHEAPLTAGQVAQACGVTEEPRQDPTSAQTRATEKALTDLARAGLAACDANGRWRPRDGATAEHRERASERFCEISQSVAAERAMYRQRGTSWTQARARALKRQLAKERAWWTQLEPDERRERRGRWSESFKQMPVAEQEYVKTQLARRRVRAGIDEAARHAAWTEAMDPDEYLERSVARQLWFATLAPPLQQAHVQAWNRHRLRFGIGRVDVPAAAPGLELYELLPVGVEIRNDAFLQEELSLFEGAAAEAIA